MAIIRHRDCTNYSLTTLSSGAIVSDTAWQDIQDAKRHANQRGYSQAHINGFRNMDRVIPAVGTWGDKITVPRTRAAFVPLVIPAYADRITITTQYRGYIHTQISGITYSRVEILINKGGAEYLIHLNTSPTAQTQLIDTFLPAEFRSNPRVDELAYLVARFSFPSSLAPGSQIIIPSNTNADYYGILYANATIYKACDTCS